MSDSIESFVKTTMGGAKDISTGEPRPLSEQQVRRVVEYLRSSESGVGQHSSFEDFVATKLREYPPSLPPGSDYVGFSGLDSNNVSNFENAREFVRARSGQAGIIGATPWGEYLDSQDGKAEIRKIARKFERFLSEQNIELFNRNYAGALTDMMWNAGSPEYFRNAVQSGRSVVAFVENAPKSRGFSNFELPVALEHPDVVMNGYPMRAFGAGDDALAFASRSAAEYQALERSIAEAATRNSGREVSVADVRSQLDLAGGYNAIDKTVFDLPRESFEQLPFDDMRSVGLRWSQVMADARVMGANAAPEVVVKAPVIESHRQTGPPKAVVDETRIAVGVDEQRAPRLDEIPDDLKPHLRKLKIHADGLPDDGAPFYPADEKHLKTYTDANEALSRFKAPRLLESDKPHQRLFVAAFDGTGNDVNQDPLHATNVAKIKDQLNNLSGSASEQIHVEYLNGPGTQRNFLPRLADGGLGYTYEDRIEEMYSRFVTQVQKWKDIDPDADVRVLSLGFSRGGSQVPGFARLVHERGVVDPDSRIEVPDENGKMVERYTRHLIAPGEIPQVIAPFDPVATGVPMHFDRRPPPSVVSGFGIFAMDEPRHKFKGDMILPLGLSEDGRFLNVPVAGCHSNIGGCYTRDGLSNRSMNLMVDYINALSDKPLLSKVYEPDDPRQTVIHRSDKHMLIYDIDFKVDRMTPDGRVYVLKPQPLLGLFAPNVPDANEPVSQRVSEKTSFYDVKITVAPAPPTVNPTVRMAEQAVALQAAEAPQRAPVSFQAKAMGAAGAIGAFASIVDAKQSADRIAALYDRGNATGAESELIHFTARSVGGWGGAVLGATVGAAVSSPTGPGAIIGGIVGGAVGVVGGEKVAEVLDHRKIYRQEDSQGKVWTLDPEKPTQGWRRLETVEELAASGRPIETQKYLLAVGELESELNRKATTASLELMLARPPVPNNPYALTADSGDVFSSKPSAWRRDPVSGVWARDVYERQYTGAERESHVLRETVVADVARSAQLEAQSQKTLRENVPLTPAAMAARFELSSHDSGWARHEILPASAANVLRDDGYLIGSDGAEYRRQQDGRWERSALFGFSTADATATMQLELDTTRNLLREGLVAHRELLVVRPQPSVLTLEASMTSMAKSEYAIHGLASSPEALSEMGRALAVDYRVRGLDGPWMMQLQRDPDTNAYGPDSPMGVYMRGTDGDMVLHFTMTPTEAKEVLATQPTSHVQDAPQPVSPERTIIQVTPVQRDAREQATREANRQGLSQEATQQAATLATIEVRAKRASPSSSRDTQPELVEEPEATSQIAEASPSQPTPPAPVPVRDTEEREPVAERKDVLPQPVAQAGQYEAKSAPSPEDRAQDAPDLPAVAQANPVADPSPQPTDAHRHVPEPPADSDAEMSVSQQPAVPAEQPIAAVPQKAGISDDDTALPVHRDSAVEIADRPSPTPPSQERADEANVVTAAPDQPPPLQEIEAPLVGSADMPHNARAEHEGRSELTMAPARTFTGGAGRAPGDAAESGEKERDDVDRREVSRAEAQIVPSDASLPPVTVLADARDRDDEEKRIDHGRRGQESLDSQRAPEQATPETAPRSFDPRHPDHPDHAMYQNAREKVADLYERHGIPTQEDQLERTTAALLSDARANRMTHIEEVQFTVSRQKPDGEMTVAGNLLAWEGDPKQQSQMPWMKFSATDMQTIDQRDPDRDYSRFREETIKEKQSLEAFQKQQEEINKNQDGPVMRIGPRSLNSDTSDSDGGDGGGGGDG